MTMMDTSFTPEQIRSSVSRRKILDAVFIIVGLLAVFVAVVTLGALLIQLVTQGAPRLNWNFFTSFPSRKPEEAGIFSAWVGSALVMLVTLTIAVPLGVAAGIYLEEYASKNWVAAVIEVNVTNLAGVPSIVYGLLALGLFARQFRLGETILTAGLTLALLILPVVIVTTREALRAIPNSLREAAFALGASRWQMIWDHILPCASGSILTGIIIGLSRAIGETAPLITIGALTFIAFLPDSPFISSFPYVSFSWIMAPFTVMPIQMFDWVSRPEQEFQLNSAAAGVVLVAMTLIMNGTAIYLRYRLRKGIKW
ncbi:MAG: phosphate ABC transporter permease PstA [Leptolyngbyaceae cyanobacterium bins.59]|nr:phosphate ABC transporter permease PstA [Leptolyngbyaceae cyanobacterium bins.59]